jgi:hypothetical protein
MSKSSLLDRYHGAPDAIRRLAVRAGVAGWTLGPDSPEPRDGTAWETTVGSLTRWFVRDDALAVVYRDTVRCDEFLGDPFPAQARWWQFSRRAETGNVVLAFDDPDTWDGMWRMGDPDAGDYGPIRQVDATGLRAVITGHVERTVA